MVGHRSPRSGPARRSRRRLALALLGALGLLSCGGEPPPDADWPPGALLSARRAPLVNLLDALATLGDTPVAVAARQQREALPDCEELAASAASASGLVGAIRCAEGQELDGLRGYRSAAGIALVLPTPEGPRALARISTERGRTRIELDWPSAAVSDGIAGLLPAEADAGAPVLSTRPHVFHARVRSDGLDLAALVPEGSQGDQLFQLRSDLLTSALLDGTWELVLYPPGVGETMPRAAAALGVRSGDLARVASEAFLARLEETWQLRPSPVQVGTASATCYPGLNLIPELAPCLVTRDGAVIAAWNEASLRQALAPDLEEPPSPAAAHVELDFRELARADLALAALQGEASGDPATDWPWRRLVARGARDGESTDWTIDLEAPGS